LGSWRAEFPGRNFFIMANKYQVGINVGRVLERDEIIRLIRDSGYGIISKSLGDLVWTESLIKAIEER